MPKVVDIETKKKIRRFARNTTQTQVAEMFGVSRMFVNSLVKNRPIKRTREQKYQNRCIITGFKFN